MRKPANASHLRDWNIVSEDTEPAHRKYYESIFTLGNGYLGVRGSREEDRLDDNSQPLTLIAEIYDDPGHEPERLAPVPNWLGITFDDGSRAAGGISSEIRNLDMKRGVLRRYARFESESGRVTHIMSSRIVSQARPHIAAIAYSILAENYSGRVTLRSTLDLCATYPDRRPQTEVISADATGSTISLLVRTLQSGIQIALAARHKLVGGDAPLLAEEGSGEVGLGFSFHAEQGTVHTLQKVVAFDTSFRQSGPLGRALDHVASAPDYAQLEKEHSQVWRDYWTDCDIRIAGDTFVQSMARFWVFQLLQAASKNNVEMGLSASVPAKALSGPGYNGHIFWDTEIYMLPFYSKQYPAIAKSLLMYRCDRLETAKANAIAEGRRGARFPWESATTGTETTPKWCPTGWQEIHVIADVPFGIWQHYLTTGDREFLMGPGLEVFLETARYWSTRAEKVETPQGHHYEINEVIGPDEMHDSVNNSVFTNAMARWNIRKAIELLDSLDFAERRRVMDRHSITDAELAAWADVADHIKINFDPDTGLYEEFDGYFSLEGDARRIKQADVLLMLHLLPELRTTEIFRNNFDVYYPVTVHGSSLSPGVHVLFALDIGYKDHAYRYERQTCSIDGTRRDGATDAGLHAASMGGGWSSIVAGFGGVRVMPDCLRVAPDLPPHWKHLAFSTCYRGQRLRFDIKPGSLRISADPEGREVPLEVNGRKTTIGPGQTIGEDM